MDSRKIVYKETLSVLIGEVILVGVMFGVFALLKALDQKVLLGGLAGGLLAVGNFFFMAIGTSLAADKAEAQNVKGGQALIQTSYLVRMVVLAVLLFACAKSGYFNLYALVIPLLFPRLSITLAEFFRKKGD
ncbi:MAG: ATP synthase subunit I [Oscillospiraceae bacterium]|nr:ATP synthase subunit I [Oscillospiraceae bacterium]